MEAKENKEERDKLFGPRGEEFRWSSYRTSEFGEKKELSFPLEERGH